MRPVWSTADVAEAFQRLSSGNQRNGSRHQSRDYAESDSLAPTHSRADLARVSGLQRGTVLLIIEQLIRERWVISGPLGRLPRGRRPTFLQLNDCRAIVVVDLRPTTTTIAISDANGRFLSQQEIPTPADSARATVQFSEKIRQMIPGHPDLDFDGIGVSVPGASTTASNELLFTPTLKWGEFDLRGPFEKATGLHVLHRPRNRPKQSMWDALSHSPTGARCRQETERPETLVLWLAVPVTLTCCLMFTKGGDS